MKPEAEDMSVASMDAYRATPVPEVSVDLEGAAPERAERPLRNALVRLRTRGETIADDASAAGVPVRLIAFSVAGAVGALALLWAGRSLARSRPTSAARPKQRSATRRVGRELGREIAARAVLGAASVIGARIATDILLPALAQKLATGTWQLPSEPTPPKRRSRKQQPED